MATTSTETMRPPPQPTKDDPRTATLVGFDVEAARKALAQAPVFNPKLDELPRELQGQFVFVPKGTQFVDGREKDIGPVTGDVAAKDKGGYGINAGLVAVVDGKNNGTWVAKHSSALVNGLAGFGYENKGVGVPSTVRPHAAHAELRRAFEKLLQ